MSEETKKNRGLFWVGVVLFVNPWFVFKALPIPSPGIMEIGYWIMAGIMFCVGIGLIIKNH